MGLRSRIASLLLPALTERQKIEIRLTANIIAANQKLSACATAGRHTYGELNVRHYPGPKLTIGSFCSIGADVTFMLGGNHRSEWITTYPFATFREMWPGAPDVKDTRSKGNIVVGNDVWFGEGALVLSGVTIGHGAVIGARAVVSKDIPPYAIVVGNPARVARYRFGDDTIHDLLDLAWWDWPDERINEILPILLSGNFPEIVKMSARRSAESPASR